MRKTFFTLIALLLSLTTVNAQMLTPDGSITVTRQHTAVINKHMAPAMGPNRIAMDADERIMGYYDSDEIGKNALGLNGSGQFKAGVDFSKAQIGHFGGAINWNGNTYSNKYTITLDSSWKPENMHVVAFINRPVGNETSIDDVYVNNAETCKLGESITAGIEAPITDKGTGVEVERYTVDGRKISKPVKGLNIVKMSDGRTIKVIVK